GGFAGTLDGDRACTLRGERRDGRLAGTGDAGVGDNAYTFRHDPRQGGFAGTLDDEGRAPKRRDAPQGSAEASPSLYRRRVDGAITRRGDRRQRRFADALDGDRA